MMFLSLPPNPVLVEWSIQQKIPDNLYREIKNIYRGDGLPLECVILNLYSGRFFGKIGVFVWDAVGIIILVLALSGIFLFYFPAGFRKRKNRLNNSNASPK